MIVCLANNYENVCSQYQYIFALLVTVIALNWLNTCAKKCAFNAVLNIAIDCMWRSQLILSFIIWILSCAWQCNEIIWCRRWWSIMLISRDRHNSESMKDCSSFYSDCIFMCSGCIWWYVFAHMAFALDLAVHRKRLATVRKTWSAKTGYTLMATF